MMGFVFLVPVLGECGVLLGRNRDESGPKAVFLWEPHREAVLIRRGSKAAYLQRDFVICGIQGRQLWTWVSPVVLPFQHRNQTALLSLGVLSEMNSFSHAGKECARLSGKLATMYAVAEMNGARNRIESKKFFGAAKSEGGFKGLQRPGVLD